MATIEEATDSLVRIQTFEISSLKQTDRLGKAFEFSNILSPAEKIIGLYKKIPPGAVHEFADEQCRQIHQLTNATYNLFDEILKFDATAGDASNKHQNLVSQVNQQYNSVFNQLYPLISYAMAQTVDFNNLAEQGRAAVQDVRDQSESMMEELESVGQQAKEVLEEVRKIAAEQGVSQQARYFAEESENHKKLAWQWQKATLGMGLLVGTYGVLSFFFNKIEYIAPLNIAEAIQFSASKLLVFFVLAYMLFLCSRNFLSHRHNEIVNKHRQNALMTYKTLVEAGATPEARDAVLNHAAASIYRLHDTGYVRGVNNSAPSSTSIVEMLPKTNFPLNQD